MAKKLKIRFTKFEKAIAMQILEQEGEFKESEHIKLNIFSGLYNDCFFLNFWISSMHFYTNQERDEYLNKFIRWISEEQFNGGMRELKVDEMCEVRDNEDDTWLKRRLVRILPEEYSCRYITNSLEPHKYLGYEYARPIAKRTEPTVEECGQLVTYTWEEK